MSFVVAVAVVVARLTFVVPGVPPSNSSEAASGITPNLNVTAHQHGSLQVVPDAEDPEPLSSGPREDAPSSMTPTTLATSAVSFPPARPTQDSSSNTLLDEKQHHAVTFTPDLEAQVSQTQSGSEGPQGPLKRIRFTLPISIPRLSNRSRLRALFTPTRHIGPAPSYARSALNTVRYSPLNVLLAFIPVSWALHAAHQSDAAVFVTSALAIIPLAALLGFGTEQIAIRTSSAVAAFLNASLGNLVELLIAGIALSRCELALVQSSLLGGLLSNLLLVRVRDHLRDSRV